MLLMLTGGPRVSEITALTWDDLSLARPGAHVLWHGKGRKERLTPLQAPAITGLRQWQRENPAEPGGFVFTARGTARKMSTNAVAERIKIHAATAAAARPGIAAKNVTPHTLRHTCAMTLQGRRVASDASFGSSREHALPAAQRAALRALGLPGLRRGCGDLGFHGPPGSDATMMQLIPLHGPHHRCACWHRDAFGSSRMHRVHHHLTQRAVPGRRRSCEGRAGPPHHWPRQASHLATSRSRCTSCIPAPGDGCSRGCQLARQPLGTPPGRHAADLAATHRSRRPADTPGLDLRHGWADPDP